MKKIILFIIFLGACSANGSFSLFQTIQHKDSQSSTFFSPDGNSLAIAEGGSVLIYHLESGEYVRKQSFSIGFNAQDIAWSQDSELLAVRYFSRLIIYRKYDKSFKLFQDLEQEDIIPKSRMGLRFCSNKSYLVSPQSKKVILYKFEGQIQKYKTFQTLKLPTKYRISVSKTCEKILASNAKEILVYSFRNNQVSDFFSLDSSVGKSPILIRNDGKQILLDSNQTLQLWLQRNQKFYKSSLQPNFSTVKTITVVAPNFEVLTVLTNKSFNLFSRQNEQFVIVHQEQLINLKDSTLPQANFNQDGTKLAITYETAQPFSRTLIFSRLRNQSKQSDHRWPMMLIIILLCIIAWIGYKFFKGKRNYKHIKPHQDSHVQIQLK